MRGGWHKEETDSGQSQVLSRWEMSLVPGRAGTWVSAWQSSAFGPLRAVTRGLFAMNPSLALLHRARCPCKGTGIKAL